MPVSAMHARQIPLADIGDAELERWRRLARAALEPNPFFEPEYLLPQARALDQVADLALAVVVDGDDWAACMPIRRARGWHRIPLGSVATWRGSRSLPSLLGTPLLSSRDGAAPLIESLVASDGASFVALDWLVDEGPVFEAIDGAVAHARLHRLEFERFERAFLTRRPENDYFERSMKGKHRGVMRRRWRKLEAELGAEPEVVDLTGDEAAVGKLIEVEGASHLAARGMVLKSDPAYERFFREMCAGFAVAGRLQLHVLRVGERTLATRCNLVADPGLFYLKVAYDEALAEFSPGIRLEVESFDLFHDRPESRWVDACSDPNNETMNRLLPERRKLVTLALVRGGVRAPATLAAIRGARSLRDRAMAK
jgi:CelD/BcsL family acetyltransferase involved in cellulose biosynthesis